MTDTTCPNCDAPAPARARRCAHCGYSFVEGGGPTERPGVPRPGWKAAVTAIAVLVLGLLAVLLTGGGSGDDDFAPGRATPRAHLEVLSEHPLARHDAELLLERRYFSVPDDDESDVRCSRREPRPAHSVRRCHVVYPGGTERTIVVLTNASGAEVLSEP
jgi:hypothetical protein